MHTHLSSPPPPHTHKCITLQKGPPPIFDMIHSKPVKRKADTSGPGGEEASTKRYKPLPELLQKLIHGDNTKETIEVDLPCKELSVDLKSISERSSAK